MKPEKEITENVWCLNCGRTPCVCNRYDEWEECVYDRDRDAIIRLVEKYLKAMDFIKSLSPAPASPEKSEVITNLCDSKCLNCGTAYSSGYYPDACPTCSKMPLVKLLLHWYYSYHRAISAHKSDDGDKAIEPHFLAVYRVTSDLLGPMRDAGTLSDQTCSEVYDQVNNKDLEIFEPAVPYKPGDIIDVKVEGCEPGPHRIGEETVPIPETERKLRELLFAEHSCAGKYGDDGERQCAECVIDFLRDPVDEIERKIQSRNFQRMTE